MSEVMEKSSALATIDTINTALVFAPGGAESLITRIEREAREQAASLDISTAKGRKEIASLAYKVARSKTALDDAGKTLKADWLAKSNAVDAERRIIRERLDALSEDIRKPLTAWEDAEKARVAAHEAALGEIEALFISLPAGASSADIAGRIAKLNTNQPRDWQEFQARAEKEITVTKAALQGAYDRAVKREEEAEAEALRQAEEAERKRQEAIAAQKEREARIAAEAAAKAKAEAEAKAEQARKAAQEAAERREKEAKEAAERAERERKAALEQAEAARVAGHRAALDDIDAATNVVRGESSASIRAKLNAFKNRPARDWQEFADEAAQAQTAGEKHLQDCIAFAEVQEAAAAERQRKADEARVEAEKAAAVAAERRRQDEERREQEALEAARKAEVEKRAANVAHRRKINREALEALVAAGLTQGEALIAVTAIAKGTVPHVTITY